MIISGGVAGLIMSSDDFVSLGRDISAFIFPYFFDVIAFSLSVFQIYTGVALRKKQAWTIKAVYVILALRVLFGFYDHFELWPAVIVGGYFLYILKPQRAGWLFKVDAAAQ